MNLTAVIDPYPGQNQVYSASAGSWSQSPFADRPVCRVCLGTHRQHSFYALGEDVVGAPCLPAVLPDQAAAMAVVVEGEKLRDAAASIHQARRTYVVIRRAAEHFLAVGEWWTERSGEVPSCVRVRQEWNNREHIASETLDAAVDSVIQWLLTLDEERATDYESALVLLVKTGYTFPEQFGLACSAHQAYLRYERARRGREAEVAARALRVTGDWLGTVDGGPQDFEGLVCDSVLSLGTSDEHPEWGERFLVKFTGPRGEAVVWFTGEGGKFDPKPGETYAVRAGVKAHDVYNDVRQTVLTRCKIAVPAVPKKGRKKDVSPE